MVDSVSRNPARSGGYRLEDFVEGVQQSLRATGATAQGIERLGPLLQRLVLEGDLLQAGDLQRIEAGEKSSRFYGSPDGGLTLVLGRFAPDRPTRVHNHGSWGVACIYQGLDRYTAWRRADPGSGPGVAKLTRVDERILERGDFVSWPEPPQDLHSQQGYNDQVAWEFVLFGHDTMGQPRLYFDIPANEAWEGPVGELRAPYPPGRSGPPGA